jgi:RND family efflux transporter MFP subunit
MMRKFVPALLLIAVAAASACSGNAASAAADAAASANAAAETPVDVPVVTATTGAVDAALEISGTLAPRTRVGVKPKMPGSLDRVLVDIGDVVREGQVVATLDRREVDAQADAAEAAVNVARAGVESAEAALENAVTERDRAKNLFDKGAVPRQRLDAAETAHRAANAQRDLAKANLAQADAAFRRAREVQRNATLTAPVAGHVVERNYDGGAIPGDQPVVVVADIRLLKLEAGVSELDAGRLKVGMPADVTVQARPGEHFKGELVAIAPEVDARNRHFDIEIRVPNSDAGLLSGMYATARIVTQSATAGVVVPREAVGQRNGGSYVLKVSGDTVTAVPVTEGLSDGRRVQIVSGLTAGDTVVADARRQFADGARVRPVPVN